MSVAISSEKLERRRRELRKRKHSFVELIMQTRKSIYRQQWRERNHRELETDLAPAPGNVASCCSDS